MRSRDLLRNREPKSDAALVGGVDLPKTIENSFQMCRGNSHAGIDYGKAHHLTGARRGETNFAIRPAEFDRIDDEIRKNAKDPLVVRHHVRRVGGGVHQQSNSVASRERLQHRYRVIEQGLHIERLRFYCDLAGLDLCHFKQIADQ